MIKSDTLDRALSTALTIAGIVIAVIVVRREFMPPTTAVPPGSSEPQFLAGWDTMFVDPVVNRVGAEDAPVQIAVFFDLECQFCARFDQDVMEPFLDSLPSDVSVAFIHYPLSIHRFAIPAAKALECAIDQRVMLPFMRQVYAQRDSLGLKDWVDMARDAGVTQLSDYESCTERPGVPERVEMGRALAETMNVRGTPSIVVNGWDLGPPPTATEFGRIIDRVRRGEDPVERD